MIELKPTELKAVYIPHGSYDVQVWNHGIGFKHDDYDGNKDSNGFHHVETGLFRWGGFRVVGQVLELSESGVYFNPKKYVEGFFKHDLSENFDCWKNYHNPCGVTYGCKTPEESFITLLKSNGVREYEKKISNIRKDRKINERAMVKSKHPNY